MSLYDDITKKKKSVNKLYDAISSNPVAVMPEPQKMDQEPQKIYAEPVERVEKYGKLENIGARYLASGVRGIASMGKALEISGKATKIKYDRESDIGKKAILSGGEFRESVGRKINEIYLGATDKISERFRSKEDMGMIEKGAGTIAEGLASSIPAITASAVTKNPATGFAIGSATMGAMEKGSSAEEYISAVIKDKGYKSEEDISDEELLNINTSSTIYGTVAGILENAVPAKMMGKIKSLDVVKKPLIKAIMSVPVTMAITGAEEGATEYAQKLAQNIIAKLRKIDPNIKITEGALEEGIAGALTGAFTFGLAEGVSNISVTQEEGQPEAPVEQPTEERKTEEKLSKEAEKVLNKLGGSKDQERIDELAVQDKEAIKEKLVKAKENATTEEEVKVVDEKVKQIERSTAENEQFIADTIQETLDTGEMEILKELPVEDRKVVIDTIKQLTDIEGEHQETATKLMSQIEDKAKEQVELRTKKEKILKEKAKKGINIKVLQKKVNEIDSKREREFDGVVEVKKKIKEIKIDKTEKIEQTKDVNIKNKSNADKKRNGELSNSSKLQSRSNTKSSGDPSKERNRKDASVDKLGVRSGTDKLAGKGKKSRSKINKQSKGILESKKYSTNFSDYSKEEIAVLKEYSGAGGKEQTGGEGIGLLSEYYTDKRLASKLWDIARQYIAPNNVFEPSVGTGNILNIIPENVEKAGIEFDKTSGTIAQILNKNAKITIGNSKDINNKGDFQSLFYDLKNKTKKQIVKKYDMVIGNPPFGKRAGLFKGYGEEKNINRQEEYFIKRSLDITNNGGIVAFIVNSSFLSKGSSKGKELLSKEGELIDAYRLPEGMFADTSIGTDIVVFKKQEGDVNDLIRDNFFEKNTNKILGEEKIRKNRFGKEEKYVSGGIENLDDIRIDDSLVEDIIKKEHKKEAKKIFKKPIKKINKNVSKKDTFNSSVVEFKDLGIEDVKISKEQDISNRSVELSDIEKDIYQNINRDGSSDYSENRKKYLNYSNGKYYNDVVYYSGNIYKKIKQLKKDKKNIDEDLYRKQMIGLEKIKPKQKNIEEIHFNPLDHKLLDKVVPFGNEDRKLSTVFSSWLYKNGVYSDPRISGGDIIGYVEGRNVSKGKKDLKGVIQDNANRLFNDFIVTALDKKTQDKIAYEFNEKKNSVVKTNYDKIPVIIKGMAKEFRENKFTASDIQKSGIGFLVNKGSGLVAYGVGVGKTHTILLATKANMDAGKTKRPAFVVPNATIEKTWIKTIISMFPDMKVVNLGGLTIKDIARLKKERGNDPKGWVKDGEMSVISHGGVLRLELTNKQIRQSVYDLSDAMFTNESTKRKKTEKKEDIKEIIASLSGTSGIKMEDIGIDHISVDEIHNFRKIFQGAKVEKDDRGNERTNRYTNVIGGKPAKQAQKLFLLSQIIQKNTGGNVFLASATPFENHATEVYNILSLIARDRLKEMGIFNINDFFTSYADFSSEIQYSGGAVVEKQVMRNFANLHSLQGLLKEFIDYKEDKTLIRPNKKVETPHLKESVLQQENNTRIQAMFNGEIYENGMFRTASEEEKKGLHLKAITYANSNAVSPYFINEWNEGFTADELANNSPKLNYAYNIIKTTKNNSNMGKKGVFVYMGKHGVSNGGQDKFAEYIKKNAGYKENEVQVLNGRVKDIDREKMKEEFNNGDIKVLIGGDNTKEGIDLQTNNVTTINLALGWNPTEPAQVEGRGWRQGNPLSDVAISYPLVENTGDAFMFQKFSEKGARINDLFSYEGKMFDASEVNADEKRLSLITDPTQKANLYAVLENKKVDKKIIGLESAIKNLELLRDKYSATQTAVNYDKETVDKYIKLKDSYNFSSVEKETYKNTLKSYKKKLTQSRASIKGIKAQMKTAGVSSINDIDENIVKLLSGKDKLEGEKEAIKTKKKEIIIKFQKEYSDFQKNRKSNDELMKEYDNFLNNIKEHTPEELTKLKVDKISKQEKYQTKESPKFYQAVETYKRLERHWNNTKNKTTRKTIAKEMTKLQKKIEKYQIKTGKEKEVDIEKQKAQIPFLQELGIEQVEKIFTMKGKEAWGKYSEGWITYAKNPDETTIPHESFHAFLDLLVEDSKVQEAFDFIRNRDGKDFSDLQAEEVLAQEFAEWFVDKKRPTNKLQQFFAYIARKFKLLVKNYSVIDELFNEATNPANLSKIKKDRRGQSKVAEVFQEKDVIKKGTEVAKLTEKLVKINNAKRKIRQDFLQSKEGQIMIAKYSIEQETITDVNPQVIQGIKNHPSFRKEGQITDDMADGYLMEKNGRYVLSGRKGLKDLTKKGYSSMLEVDSLAQEAGFDNSLEYLENQISISNERTLLQKINEALMEKSTKESLSDDSTSTDVKEYDYATLSYQSQNIYTKRRKLYKDQESFYIGKQAMKILQGAVISKIRKANKEKQEKKLKEFKEQLSTLSDRRKKVKAIQEHFNLSNAQLKRAKFQENGKTVNIEPNIQTMSKEDFDLYLDELFVKAGIETELSEKRERASFIIWNKELSRVESLAKAMKLPKMEDMTSSELDSFIEVLDKAEKNDVFLTQRELETMKNTDTKDAKTLREIREAYGIGDDVIDFKVLSKTKVMRDNLLSRKHPIFKVWVDLWNKNSLIADKLYLSTEGKTVELMKKARSSRKRSWKDLFTQEDKLIFEYLESKDKQNVMSRMTKEEIEAAKYMEEKLARIRDYLITNEFLTNGYVNDYMTHQRKNFLEKWRSSDFISAVKDTWQKQDEDAAIFNILSDTGEILPLEKFASFLLHRGDESIDYSENAQRVFLNYVNSFEKKKALDATMPVLDALVIGATPVETTDKGLVMDRSLKTFYNQWMNNKKGRRHTFGNNIMQGGRVDRFLRTAITVLSIKFLAGAYAVQMAAFGGEQMMTFVGLGGKNYGKGIKRLNTKQGKKIVENYRNFIGKSIAEDFKEKDNILSKIDTLVFAGFSASSLLANKQFFLGSMTENEFAQGKVTPERLAELRNELGRWRITPRAKSVVGSTSAISMSLQFKEWAIPVANTLTGNMKALASGNATKQQRHEMARVLATLMFATAVYYSLGDDDDDPLKRKVVRDLFTAIGALNPEMWLSAGTPPVATELIKAYRSLKAVLLLEKYKNGNYKAPNKIKQLITPSAIKQF